MDPLDRAGWTDDDTAKPAVTTLATLDFGDGRSGKSAALRAYVHEVVRTRSPEQAQIVVVDYRRSLLGEIPEDHLLHYLTSGTQAVPALADLAGRLTHRLPGLQVTPDQLRTRSGWRVA